MIIKAGAIPSFCEFLRSAKDCIVIDAVTARHIIVKNSNVEHIQEVEKAGRMHKNLVHILDSKGDLRYRQFSEGSGCHTLP